MNTNKPIHKVQVAILAILAIFAMSSAGWAATYYVRPISGEYSAEDGSDYDNAFDGFADITWGSLGGGDTLFVAGTFSNQLDVQASGTSDNARLSIMSCTIANGASADDPGIIDGVDFGGSQAGALQISQEDYITVDGLSMINTTGTGDAMGVLVSYSNYITIRNCDINNSFAGGLYVHASGSSQDYFVLEFNDIEDNGGNGILTSDFTTSAIIRYNYFDGNGTSSDPARCTPSDQSKSFFHNIYIGHIQNGGEHFVYGNQIINGVCGQGVKVKNNAKIYYNYIDNNEEMGFMAIERGVGSDQYYYYNVIANNNWANFLHWQESSGGTTNLYLYNNTFYEGGQAGEVTLGNASVESFTAKNNIVYGSKYGFKSNSGAAPLSSTIDYNICFGRSESSKYLWDGAGKTFAQWQALGFDTNTDAYEAPIFTDAANGDFTLQSNSPAIDAGEDLGDTYTNALDPSTTWTRQNPGIIQSSVATVNQDNHGTGWEVGAYVFYGPGGVPPSVPTGLKVMQ